MREIEELMKKAKRYLKGAERDFNAGDYFMSVSRSYYCMFTAIRALLLLKGITTRTHKGLIKKFGEEYIKTGIFSQELGKAVNMAQREREIGDYSISADIISRDKAEKILEYAKEFLHEAEKYLEEQRQKVGQT